MTDKALTKEDPAQAFGAIGVRAGMALKVHSSLSSFGRVEGGVETVIAALMESVGESGSIFMPALRLSPVLPLTDEDRALGITTKIRVLPEERGRAGSCEMMFFDVGEVVGLYKDELTRDPCALYGVKR